ncbi:AraC family transcriptional regulator [Marinobacter caseinilyticus]|uniref:AraC family transcriptional regulator n=1 Tax=Marinobacter caseinilyticus TaxID=2692195 RepID=UPI001F3B9A64|nr:AraC family transcriptional regulator [Marinobacter caseinilyticus]
MSDLSHLFRFWLVKSALILLLSSCSGSLWAESLDQEIDTLKADVAALNQTLFELEEEVLHPTDTQVAVYLSMADPEALVLESVELAINGLPAIFYLYTDPERQALEQGGVQRLYVGNLPFGEHQLNATLNGQAANDHYVRREAEFTIRKSQGKKQVQLVLTAPAPEFQPELSLKEWQ